MVCGRTLLFILLYKECHIKHSREQSDFLDNEHSSCSKYPKKLNVPPPTISKKNALSTATVSNSYATLSSNPYLVNVANKIAISI